MKSWANDSVFYHIYPLGLCGAPKENDFSLPVNYRLDKLYDWVDHLKDLGINAMYLGPVFESNSHGYDTKDYYQVDRRLGDNQSLAKLIAYLQDNGIRVILDGVFNHVGREFWAFKDVLEKQQDSKYCNWFAGLDFNYQSPYGDPFTYEAWEGHYNLVKLNLKNKDVKEYLFNAVKEWIDQFNIDGLRLDAADCLDKNFIVELGELCRGIRSDFWILGEVIHGDYRKWAGAAMMDSITNYECYKGLYSSHNDKNYFEIAYSLKRQFGEEGIYKHLPLYNFVDNHDVNRISTTLDNPAYLYPLHILLFTMPGVPSIYYGSEWGIEGKKIDGNDDPLRPELKISKLAETSLHRDLVNVIKSLADIRKNFESLRYGSYSEIFVDHQQFAFLREYEDEKLLVVVNSSDKALDLNLDIDLVGEYKLKDLLNGGEEFLIDNNKAKIKNISPYWGRIMKLEKQ
ncbi:alpha-amylase family glycosyl hydrolase [Orenia marismortui]|uniref:Glycosidase n=1 Tax=Orenia marismortui TaxID=46469 RepID=A0A4R8H1L7_9FIRM|nr:alpha-amylase family glycosyl hydrolase [Orenia marismortui]TDX48460.1 glycosidase [Orenia marismortui]